MADRQIVLDTETTGLEPAAGHRIIEIGGVEIRDRRLTGEQIHFYLQPDREIDAEAQAVHGISNEFLTDKPRFADIAEQFIGFVKGAELIIHNAAFDVGFLDHELDLWGQAERINGLCEVLDTLVMARRLHPGQRNSLDALCRRYNIDNSQRELHGALLDATLLTRVYLAMTGGQVALSLDAGTPFTGPAGPVADGLGQPQRRPGSRAPLRVITASDAELDAHRRYLDRLAMDSGQPCLWQQLDGEG